MYPVHLANAKTQGKTWGAANRTASFFFLDSRRFTLVACSTYVTKRHRELLHHNQKCEAVTGFGVFGSLLAKYVMRRKLKRHRRSMRKGQKYFEKNRVGRAIEKIGRKWLCLQMCCRGNIQMQFFFYSMEDLWKVSTGNPKTEN